jgi:hypothetical protein
MANTDHEGYKKIQCWIPLDIWDKIEALSYPNQTNAVTDAFKALLDKSQNNPISSHDVPPLAAQVEGLQLLLQEKDERIQDLSKQVDSMSMQLGTKDDQITQLNEVTQKQAVHIQSLIQENSKLNTKLLPELTEKKPWWKIW